MLEAAGPPVDVDRPPVGAPDASTARPGTTRRRGARGPVPATLAMLALAIAWQLLTIRHGGASSLSDLPHLALHRGIAPAHPPYFDRMLEYPVGAGALFYVATLVTGDPIGVLLVTAVGASVAVVAATVLLAGRSDRAWRWALGPPVFLFAFQNWDAFAIAALVGGLVAFERRRPAAAGVLLGVGTVIKLFPGAAVPVLVAAALTRRDRTAATRLGAAFAATVALVNVPVIVFAPHGWWWTVHFQSARAATWGTVWMYAYRVLGLPTHGAAAAHLANVVAAVALGLGLVGLVVVTVRRRLDPIAAALAAVVVFVLANKVYSPTYDFWLVPAFVLLPIRRRTWLTFCALDLGVYVVVFGWFHGLVPRFGVATVLPWLVVVRAAVLVGVVVVALRSGPAGAAAAPAVQSADPGRAAARRN